MDRERVPLKEASVLGSANLYQAGKRGGEEWRRRRRRQWSESRGQQQPVSPGNYTSDEGRRGKQ